MKQVYVFGHKNPDIDSVCSAICVAYLKNKLKVPAVPKVIGPLNSGAKFVLDYFKVDTPSYLNDVKVQIKDVNYLKRGYVNYKTSIYDAFVFMKENNITAVPLVDDARHVNGYVSLRSMAKYFADSPKGQIVTNINHLLKVLNASTITSFDEEINGYVNSLVFNGDSIGDDYRLNDNSIVIIGDNVKVIKKALNEKVKLIILAKGNIISGSQQKIAKANRVNVISTPYSVFEICNKIILTNYINLLSTTDKPISLDTHSYYSDFIDLMKSNSYTTYPVVNNKGICLGLINTNMVDDYLKKQVILVDHNSYEESIDGLKEAEILEIIDHHCLGSIGTSIPISFIARPVGCTATIIYDEFRKEKVSIPKYIAGLLVSAIISDTLLFTSPTTTKDDIEAAKKLAKIAKVDLDEYGKELLKASTSTKGLSIEELIKQDFKTYEIKNNTYGIAVITTFDYDELKKDVPKYVEKLNDMHEHYYAGVLMFILDLLKGGSYVIYDDSMKNKVANAFGIDELEEGYFIKGLISRKKQILPALIKEIEK